VYFRCRVIMDMRHRALGQVRWRESRLTIVVVSLAIGCKDEEVAVGGGGGGGTACFNVEWARAWVAPSSPGSSIGPWSKQVMPKGSPVRERPRWYEDVEMSRYPVEDFAWAGVELSLHSGGMKGYPHPNDLDSSDWFGQPNGLRLVLIDEGVALGGIGGRGMRATARESVCAIVLYDTCSSPRRNSSRAVLGVRLGGRCRLMGVGGGVSNEGRWGGQGTHDRPGRVEVWLRGWPFLGQIGSPSSSSSSL